jgi:hypothetical protein
MSPSDRPIVWWILYVWIGWTVFGIFTLGMAYKRRQRQPLKARSPSMTVASAFGGYILLTWCAWLEANVFLSQDGFDLHGPYALCSVGIWALYIGHPLLLLPYILRCYRLYFVFNYNVEQVEKHRRAMLDRIITNGSPRRVRSTSPTILDATGSTRPSRRMGSRESSSHSLRAAAAIGEVSSTHDDVNFFYKKRHRMSETWLVTRLAALLLVFVLYTVVNQYLLSEGQNQKDSYITNDICPSQHLGFVTEWEVIEFIEQVIFVLALYHLWDVIDTFSIRTELLSIFVVWIAWSGLRVALAIPEGGLDVWIRYEPRLVIARSIVLYIVSVVMPLMHTYGIAAGEVTLWSFPTALESLETVLKDHLCMQVFQQYMTQCLSVQHVNFWLSVVMYEDIDTHQEVFSDERFEEAQRMYSEYIGTEAETPIAVLTVGQRLNIKNELLTQRAPLTLFDEAKRAVFKDMEANAFPGFTRSKLYQRLKVKLEIQSRTYGALKDSGMISDV